MSDAGWERRFIADGQRAEEVIALYRNLGYEVRAEALAPQDLREECEDCRLVTLLKFQVIYTRKRMDR